MRNTLSNRQLSAVRRELERERERFGDDDARKDSYAHALRRMDEGNYGSCVSCGNPIPLDRLLVIPETPHCITCGSRS